MVTVTKEQIENFVQSVDSHAADLWTFVVGGISGTSTWMISRLLKYTSQMRGALFQCAAAPAR
ncbi:hypothetical protein [Paraburkholderia solisilvae]|uniref:Uncharacterized protein n=1 Tax=Paraburkholderia solisilvae TaxID=624376 RepID=A0A6J5DGS3_9BURK|nr:hypothetical protein [Paraburkholderia solisilvae]CAB3752657.1 hypothetical protein LMG29739_01552 [Paraburkholderia solisilvae]